MHTVTVDSRGITRYHNSEGQLHRLDGPAIIYADGDQVWYQNGVRHRTDGPAVERACGTRMWYLNGVLHRDDGPAVENPNGYRAWHLNGELLRISLFREHSTVESLARS